jgi:hypothetical protein
MLRWSEHLQVTETVAGCQVRPKYPSARCLEVVCTIAITSDSLGVLGICWSCRRNIGTTRVLEGALLRLQIATHLMCSSRQMLHPCHTLVRTFALHSNAPALNLASANATPLTLSLDVTIMMANTASRCPVLSYMNSRLVAFLSSPLTCHLVGTCLYSGGILLRPPAHNTLSGTMWRQVVVVLKWKHSQSDDAVYVALEVWNSCFRHVSQIKNNQMQCSNWLLLSNVPAEITFLFRR